MIEWMFVIPLVCLEPTNKIDRVPHVTNTPSQLEMRCPSKIPPYEEASMEYAGRRALKGCAFGRNLPPPLCVATALRPPVDGVVICPKRLFFTSLVISLSSGRSYFVSYSPFPVYCSWETRAPKSWLSQLLPTT
ncbi:hypothetical protein ECG_07805 [Echinococcus granulosus]|nr:hypothetical protein ECG_07805 [Echinococcus granulosus]